MASIGGICWWCYWGWPKQIADIYTDAVAKADGIEDVLDFGQGYTVWSNENWDCAQMCLDYFSNFQGQTNAEETAINREALERLLKVPDEFKHCPSDYDGVHPENFPPPSHWVMASLITRKIAWLSVFTATIESHGPNNTSPIKMANTAVDAYDAKFPPTPTKSDADKTEGQ